MGCGCEFVGNLVVNDGSTSPIFTTPQPRGGNAVTCVLDVMELDTASATLEVTLEHKNRGDTSWSGAVSFSSISATGVQVVSASGIKEMVRWSFALGTGATAGDLYRVQKNLVWRPY